MTNEHLVEDTHLNFFLTKIIQPSFDKKTADMVMKQAAGVSDTPPPSATSSDLKSTLDKLTSWAAVIPPSQGGAKATLQDRIKRYQDAYTAQKAAEDQKAQAAQASVASLPVASAQKASGLLLYAAIGGGVIVVLGVVLLVKKIA
jgi:hypothetical protein